MGGGKLTRNVHATFAVPFDFEGPSLALRRIYEIYELVVVDADELVRSTFSVGLYLRNIRCESRAVCLHPSVCEWRQISGNGCSYHLAHRMMGRCGIGHVVVFFVLLSR